MNCDPCELNFDKEGGTNMEHERFFKAIVHFIVGTEEHIVTKLFKFLRACQHLGVHLQKAQPRYTLQFISPYEMDDDMESANSLVERGAERNKRKWADDEDEKLVEALMELVNTGNFKADNGFKFGYLTFLENSLQIKFPKSGLKGKPHIKSRINTLKKNFGAVTEGMCGFNILRFIRKQLNGRILLNGRQSNQKFG
ncbi:hypothetical protein POM88_045700 [Heracleum sosnowskyi]|uniref:Myb/SANT-like domain-containing protein n=1 Tax=Heracleum sosnowskyi TaxID=360622 RepID=A0AAD8H7D3_9APIA|nr:hypothetical protein POM88_045700 [Heracleum sosnowskyi]